MNEVGACNKDDGLDGSMVIHESAPSWYLLLLFLLCILLPLEGSTGHPGKELLTHAQIGAVEQVSVLALAHAGNSSIINYVNDGDGGTALHWAVYNAHREVVSLLLSTKGRDVNLRDKFGDTALHKAVFENQDDIVSLLVNEVDININAQNSGGGTALFVAAFQGRSAALILVNCPGIDLNLPNKHGRHGRTPLKVAIDRGHRLTAAILRSHGASLRATGDAPESLAASATAGPAPSDCSARDKNISLLATVLSGSGSGNEARFARAKQSLFFFDQVRRETPLTYTDPDLPVLAQAFQQLQGRNLTTPRELKAFSNFYAFHQAILRHAHDRHSHAGSWRIFLEDDAALHPNVKSPVCALLHGLELSRNDGIVYLGLCSPRCVDPKLFSDNLGGIEYSKCSGTCAHAFGMTKFKAQSILPILSSLRRDYHNHDEAIYFDIGLFAYGKLINPIWTIGTNLRSSPPKSNIRKFAQYIADHRGIFFQDRARFETTIG